MANPYSTIATTGYNSNPPVDDGSETEANRVKWATIKTKLNDPIKTKAEAMDAALVTAFGKVAGGIVSTAISLQVTAAMQGQTIVATVAGVTITTPDAASVQSPFKFTVLNLSSGDITIDGFSTQTINSALTLTLGASKSVELDTDSSNWFSDSQPAVLSGSQLGYASIINGTIVESNGSNAVTFSLKTLAGADPSSADPVLLCFRNVTLATGNYVYRTVTAALTLVISSGSTLGATNGVPFRVWIVLFDDAGTIRMGAINCVSGTTIYPLGRVPRVSSTAEGGAGAADSAQVFYTGTAVSSKPYIILAHADYESGLAAAGSWNVDPTLQLYGPGVPLPGFEIQAPENFTGAVATGTTTIPQDDTIPQITEGTEFMTQAITPTSATNLLRIEHYGNYMNSAAQAFAMALFQDATANALAAVLGSAESGGGTDALAISWSMRAATTSSTTFRIRAGPQSGTMTFNGVSAARRFGGVASSYLRVREISS